MKITRDYYITQVGESVRDVAEQFAPDQSTTGVNAYLKHLLAQNELELNSLGFQGWMVDMSLMNTMTIMLPMSDRFGDYEEYPIVNQLADGFHCPAHCLNKKDLATRQSVASLVRETSLDTLSAPALLVDAINRVMTQRRQILATGSDVILATLEQTTDFIREGAEDICNRMLIAEEKLKIYLASPYGSRTAAKQAFFTAHREVKEALQRNVQRVTEKYTLSLRRVDFVSSREKFMKKYTTGIDSFELTDTRSFKSITRLAGMAKYVGRGCILVNLGLMSTDVYETYKEGGDWQREALSDAAGFGAGALVGTAAAMAIGFLTPVGWVVVIGAAAASIYASYTGQSIADKSLAELGI